MQLGALLYTNDINQVQMASVDSNTKILFISDPEGYQDIIRQFRLVTAPAWVPDYNVMEADLNGDPNEFAFKYLDYLNRPEAQVMFATILLALYQKKNLVLFFPPESWEFKYPQFLINYIYNNYGLMAGNTNTTFNAAYSDKIASILYSYSFIPVQDFILNTESMDEKDLMKVMYDLQIPMDLISADDKKPILNFIEAYKQDMLKEQKILFKPMIVGGLLC